MHIFKFKINLNHLQYIMGQACSDIFENKSPIGNSVDLIHEEEYQNVEPQTLDPETKRHLEQLQNEPGTPTPIQAQTSSLKETSSRNTKARTSTTKESGETNSKKAKEPTSCLVSFSISESLTLSPTGRENSPRSNTSSTTKGLSKRVELAGKVDYLTWMDSSSLRETSRQANRLMENSQCSILKPKRGSSLLNLKIIPPNLLS